MVLTGFVIYLHKMYNIMQTVAKEQTAFRFDPSLISRMKFKAKSLNITVNAYVTKLIESDLQASMTLPKVTLPRKLDDDIAQFTKRGFKPSEKDLISDERLRRIWER